jgi:YHS domain-containing protein
VRDRVLHACTLGLLLAAAAVVAVSAERLNADRSGLALKGYDAVAYFVDGRAVEGHARFEHVVGNTRYRFASSENRDRFAQDPQRYLPQYGGFCAYAVSRGYTADIDPLAWKIVGGRLFLNYSQRAQRKWEEDVPGNIRKGDANWPALSRR